MGNRKWKVGFVLERLWLKDVPLATMALQQPSELEPENNVADYWDVNNDLRLSPIKQLAAKLDALTPCPNLDKRFISGRG